MVAQHALGAVAPVIGQVPCLGAVWQALKLNESAIALREARMVFITAWKLRDRFRRIKAFRQVFRSAKAPG